MATTTSPLRLVSLKPAPSQLAQSAAADDIARALGRLEAGPDDCQWHGLPIGERLRLIAVGKQIVVDYLIDVRQMKEEG